MTETAAPAPSRSWSPAALRPLLDPRSIAILGCSPDNAGGVTLRSLLDNAYDGAIFPVHPRHREVFGVPAFAALADIPDPVDCVVIALRAELVPAALDDLHAVGVRAAVIYASGFGELGERGRRLEDEVRAKLAEYEIAACGPNCLGLISFGSGATMYYAGLEVAPRRGPLAFVSHSGSSCIAVTNADRGSGFTSVVSCGNELGVGVADYVRYLADDPGTQVIALHLETVRDPAALAEAARYARERGKPVVVMKTGRSEVGQRVAAAHSGALASPHALAEAFFRRSGIVLVKDVDELLETCELLVVMRGRELAAETVAVTAVSGGMAGLSADVGAECGVEFARLGEASLAELTHALSAHSTPGNPLDVTLALHDTEAYRACLETLDRDPEVGLIAVCQGAEPGLNEQQRALYAPIARMVTEFAAGAATPTLCFSPYAGGVEPTFAATLREAGVPLLRGTRASMEAIRNLVRWQSRPGDAPDDDHADVGPAPQLDSGTLSEREGKSLLAGYGILGPRERLAADPDAAALQAAEIGFPVVLKVDTPDIAHKTEAGIVRLGLGSAAEVRGAAVEIVDNARRYAPRARINGISVQEMVYDGVEMMLGVTNDPVFGPAVLVGAGGIYAEILTDVATELAPVSAETAARMIESLRCYSILCGARGRGPYDVAALQRAVVGLSRLAWDLRDRLGELDVNPLVVLEEGRGVRALDALVISG